MRLEPSVPPCHRRQCADVPSDSPARALPLTSQSRGASHPRPAGSAAGDGGRRPKEILHFHIQDGSRGCSSRAALWPCPRGWPRVSSAVFLSLPLSSCPCGCPCAPAAVPLSLPLSPGSGPSGGLCKLRHQHLGFFSPSGGCEGSPAAGGWGAGSLSPHMNAASLSPLHPRCTEDVEHAKTVKAEREKPEQLMPPRCGGCVSPRPSPVSPRNPGQTPLPSAAPACGSSCGSSCASAPGPSVPWGWTGAVLPPGTPRAASGRGMKNQLL